MSSNLCMVSWGKAMAIKYREDGSWVRVKRGRGMKVAPPKLADPSAIPGSTVAAKTHNPGVSHHSKGKEDKNKPTTKP